MNEIVKGFFLIFGTIILGFIEDGSFLNFLIIMEDYLADGPSPFLRTEGVIFYNCRGIFGRIFFRPVSSKNCGLNFMFKSVPPVLA